MAFPAAVLFAGVFGQRQRPQRHPLVDADVFADAGGLADDHSRPVVDGKALVDLGPGVDVDPGEAVGMLGHDPRQERHPQFEEAVGNPVDRDGIDARVAEDDFIVAARGRVAVVSGAHIGGQDLADGREVLEELQGELVAAVLAVGAGLLVAEAIVADAAADLLGQPVEHPGGGLPHAVAQRHGVDLFTAEIAGEEQFANAADDLHHDRPGRERLVVDERLAIVLRATGDDRLGDAGKPRPIPGKLRCPYFARILLGGIRAHLAPPAPVAMGGKTSRGVAAPLLNR